VTFIQETDDTIYHVTVPTYRTTKDISIPEDIVEEIARLYGFENITYQRPTRLMKSFDISVVEKIEKMKQHCAFALKMHEVRDYLFYDESFLKRLDWYPKNAVAIKNPVSENWKVLVTSLIPHLIKNVELNSHSYEQINLFEHNNIWREISASESVEHKALSGIFFGDKDKNFYDYKAELVGLFTSLDLPVVWAKCQTPIEPWFDQLQTADLVIDGVKIGRAGTLSATFVKGLVKGKGFVFELSSDLMVAYPVAAKQYKPWSKYQAVSVDISMLIDADKTADMISATIKTVDDLILNVELVDFFEKESWGDKRSLTMRYIISDFTQTLTKEVIDTITEKVQQAMINIGGQVR
jgi:phenylalanyl-tRNA synthetase beta chain